MKRMIGLMVAVFAVSFASVSQAETSLPQAVSQGMVNWQNEGSMYYSGAGLQWQNFRIDAPKDYIRVQIPQHCAQWVTVNQLRVNGSRVNPFSGMVENYNIPWARVHVWNDGYSHNRAYETNPGLPTPNVSTIQIGMYSPYLVQNCEVQVYTAMKNF